MPVFIATRLSLTLESPGETPCALQDFDLTLGDGETLAIVATEPWLVSALLRALAGTPAADTGGLLVDGRETAAGDPRIELIGPRPDGFGMRKVTRYLGRAASATVGRHLAPRGLEDWARHCLHLAGADDLAELRLRALGPTSAVRVQLARAIASGAPLLYFDRVFDGLDEVACRQSIDLMLELQQRLSCSMVFATEDVEQAVLFADRVLHVERRGRKLVWQFIDVNLLRPRARLDLLRGDATVELLTRLRRLLGLPEAPRPDAGSGAGEARNDRAGPEVIQLADWVSSQPQRTGKRLEKTELALGFVPLVDCAPLAIALEEGFFEAAGLHVRLSRESSWSNVGDKVALGLLDGAQMLCAQPLASAMTVGATPIVTALALGRNGNAITVSNELHRRLVGDDDEAPPPDAMQAARALADEVARRRQARRRQLVLAVVSLHSTHNYLLRYWLACGGVDPDHDVRMLVVPPQQMVGYLGTGMIDGFCAGEPWNSVAEADGLGRVLLASRQIWDNHPEKVLGVTRAWAEANPNSHRALLRALMDACWWLDKADNREAACEILARGRYVNVNVELLRASLGEAPGGGRAGQVFHAGAANFPWHSHAAWLVSQMVRWGQCHLPKDVRKLCAASYRTDLYLDATAFGDAQPEHEWKAEGSHGGEWQMEGRDRPVTLGADLFMDGRSLADWDLDAYLAEDAIPACRPGETADHAA
ncbi:MAG: ABC transporter substrate-binding protein [Rhodocyclaceae bacterium]|nr:ABC transporter substrate-binding protein [Rhodocyclaceae bacterium]